MSFLGGLLRSEGPKFEAESGGEVLGRGSELPPHQLGEPRPQIHFGPTKSLENASSGRKCRAQFNFFTEHRQSRGTLGYHWRNP